MYQGACAFKRPQNLKLKEFSQLRRKAFFQRAGALRAPLNSHILDSCLLFLYLELALFLHIQS